VHLKWGWAWEVGDGGTFTMRIFNQKYPTQKTKKKKKDKKERKEKSEK
jgi:hypothetical protein